MIHKRALISELFGKDRLPIDLTDENKIRCRLNVLVLEMVMRKMIFAVLISLIAFGCGGGGGGGPKSFAGRWAFVSTGLTVDDCNLGVDLPSPQTWVVNQDGNRIVLDVGSLVLQGAVKEGDNGFDVNGSGNLSNGCIGAWAISTTIDGNSGTAGVATSATCGSLTCTIGSGGVIERLSPRSLQAESADWLQDYGVEISDLVKERG